LGSGGDDVLIFDWAHSFQNRSAKEAALDCQLNNRNPSKSDQELQGTHDHDTEQRSLVQNRHLRCIRALVFGKHAHGFNFSGVFHQQKVSPITY
jgi:hypothetical protein